MSIQPTASKSTLLLQCPRPFSEGVEIEREEPGEAALYGTRFHAAMAAALLSKWPPVPPSDVDLAAHVKRAYDELLAWMAPAGNPWGYEFHVAGVEVSKALLLRPSANVFEGDVIDATLVDPDGEHRYEAQVPLGRDVIFGTADLILEAVYRYSDGEGHTLDDATFRVVFDHKTGEDYANEYAFPAQNDQMRTLGLMFDADAVAILHAPRGSAPVVYAHEFRQDVEGVNQATELRRSLETIDSGFLRTGPECRYCPARRSCPTQVGNLLVETTSLMSALLSLPRSAITERFQRQVDAGRFHQLRPNLEALIRFNVEEIREQVKNGAVIERPDGKVLEIATRNVERVSKKSIIEAYGREEGENVLQRLRADGALVMNEEEVLRAK